MERIAAVDRAVRAGRFPNAGTVARELEVCRRTVQRDIEFMRCRLGAPLVFVPGRRGYTYSDPTFRLPTLDMTEGELLALALAGRVLAEYRGTPYGPDLERAFRKVTAGLTESVTVDLGRLAESYSFRTTAPAPFDPGVFRDLAAAVRARRRVRMAYWSASRGEETRREVDPYHLASIDGQWNLVAYCHERSEVRMFNPARIRALEQTEATFSLPEDFDIGAYLAGSFAMLRGGPGESYHVRLRFRGDAVKYARERAWHPSQVVESAGEGELVVGFELSHLREVERWVLSWGPDCEVLGPDELRDRVTRSLADALAGYRTRPPDRSPRGGRPRGPLRGPSRR